MLLFLGRFFRTVRKGGGGLNHIGETHLAKFDVHTSVCDGFLKLVNTSTVLLSLDLRL